MHSSCWTRYCDRNSNVGYGILWISCHFWREGGVLPNGMEAGAFVFLASMLFGAVVSATDRLRLLHFQRIRCKKLGTLIEGESLLNDGTAIVAFVLLLVVTAEPFLGTGSFIGSAALGFGQIGAAGGLLGVLLGLVAILWVRKCLTTQ